MAQCSGPVSTYGACIMTNLDTLKKGNCEEEFARMQQCISESV